MSGQHRASVRLVRWRRAALLGALTLGATSAPAFAQPGATPERRAQSVGLAWSGPGPELDCLGEDGLARAVSEYVGRDAFASGSVELVLRVEVERLADRSWHALLTLSDLSERALGKRELATTDERCSSLNEPLTLAVALMVDSEPEPEPARAEPERPPDPEPDPEPPSPSRGRFEPEPEPWAFHADAALALELGLLPSARPGLAVGLEVVAAPWLSARLGGVGFVPASLEVAPGASARFALLGATLELCPGVGEVRGSRVESCVGPFYGALAAESSGLAEARSRWRRLLAASVAIRVRVPLATRWAFAASVAGVVPHRPDRFTYVENGKQYELFRVSGFSLLATAGASFMF